MKWCARVAGLCGVFTVLSLSAGAQAVAPPAQAVVFPTFGLSVVPPPVSTGWTRVTETGSAEVGRWEKADPQTGRVLAVVTAEAAPLRGKTLEQVAAALAGGTHGAVLTDVPAQLDGAPAVRVGMPRPADDGSGRLVRVGCAVAVHGKYSYLVGGHAVASEVAATARVVEAVRQSWRWVEVEPPSIHVTELRDEPLPAAGGRLLMSVPAAMRPLPVKERKTQSEWGLFNFGRGEIDFVIHADVGPAEGMDTAYGRYEFTRKLMRRAGGNADASPVRWQPVSGRPGVWLSSTLRAPPDRRNPGAPPRALRLCVVELDRTTVAMVGFTITPGADDPTAMTAYEAAVAAIAATIRPAAGR